MHTKPVPDYPLYTAHEDGQIWSDAGKRPKFLKPSDNGHGYKYVWLHNNEGRKRFYVHRVITRCFLGSDPLDVNHKDGDKANNALDNLEYVTRSENTLHAVKKGLIGSGLKHPSSRINRDTLHQICRKLLDTTDTYKKIADTLGSSRTTVWRIAGNQTYRDITKQYWTGELLRPSRS